MSRTTSKISKNFRTNTILKSNALKESSKNSKLRSKTSSNNWKKWIKQSKELKRSFNTLKV